VSSSRLSYRVKLVFFLLCGIFVLFLFDTAYEGLNTLSRLNVIEAERDQWQRPSDVIQALDLRPGNVVVDLGCGSGYFTLKLSAPVGQSGSVLAEDIRRLPLAFLWLRTFQRRQHNVSIVYGEPDDPHLPMQGVNAVLIANRYHEFTNSQAILVHVVRSLGSGGRLVVVDREPRPVEKGSTGTAAEHHEVSSEQVESELRQAGFEIVSRQDRFIENDPSNENWWLIAARKP
jgi:ubiquinone/menaquinone biosynthesis C-methylase UbiE